MKHFIRGILIFILPLIIFSYPLDVFISKKVSDTSLSTGEYEVWNDIYEGNIDAEIAIYGSSRAWCHFDTRIFEDKLNTKTYNFGIDGHNFWLEYLRHKKYTDLNKQPKLIILSLDIFSLGKKNELFNYTQFLPYMLWDKEIYNFTSSYQGFSKLEYFIPLFRYMGKRDVLSTIFIRDTVAYRYKGFKGREKKWNNDLKKAKTIKNNNRTDIDKNLIALLNNFIIEIKRKGIDLIFVYSPEYIEGQSYTKNRDSIISLYSDISYKNKIPFFNYSDSLISYQKKLFYNTLHLNKTGAEIFTNKLIIDLQKNKKTLKYLPNGYGIN